MKARLSRLLKAVLIMCSSPVMQYLSGDTVVCTSDGSNMFSCQGPTDNAAHNTGIEVRGGAWIQVSASGCVGGSSYVQPYRRTSQGLIFIPGVTMAFVPIADLIDEGPKRLESHRDTWVAGWRNVRLEGSPQAASVLDLGARHTIWLAYGPYFHSRVEVAGQATIDVQKPIPCSSGTPPAVTLELRPVRPAAADPRAPFDLQIPLYDSNLIPLNPTWDNRPDVCDACGGFAFKDSQFESGGLVDKVFDFKACTHDHPYIDYFKCGVGGVPCNGHNRLKGHVDWGPATFEGRVALLPGCWLLLDGDVDFNLKVPGFQRLGVEFATYETFKYFSADDWWSGFRFKRYLEFPLIGVTHHTGRRGCAASGWRDQLENARAVVTGILGLDNEHEAHPELHPVFALAVQTVAEPGRSVWQVFVRNWGNQGDCGNRNCYHRLNAKTIRLTLAAADESARRVGACLHRARGGKPASGCDWRSWSWSNADKGITVSIDLPPDDTADGPPHPVVYGKVCIGANCGDLPEAAGQVISSPTEPQRLTRESRFKTKDGCDRRL
jgi:hypothetical protein